MCELYVSKCIESSEIQKCKETLQSKEQSTERHILDGYRSYFRISLPRISYKCTMFSFQLSPEMKMFPKTLAM